MIFESHSAEDTFVLGKHIGEKACAGDIYCLDGDLGTGKTVLTQGLAAGLGIEDYVNSPTFTIVQEYEGRLPLYHFDVYRLADEEEIGYEEYFFGPGVTVIEWPERVRGLIPAEAKWIRIEKDLVKGMDYRRIQMEGRPE